MKAVYETIEPKKQQQSFMAYHLKLKQFHFKWHYHPEYELTLIIKGKGKRLVGDSYQSFVDGDLVLLGSNLPHTWASDLTLTSACEAIVIQFSIDFIQSFIRHHECKSIEDLLTRATSGLTFNKAGLEQLLSKIQQLPTQKGTDRIVDLLSILNGLSHRKSKPLSSTYFQPLLGTKYEKRINKVCQFIQKNTDEPLSLKKVASLVNLSESAFCKFFKRLTGKTYSDYVNEVRIGRACERILITDKTIAEAAYASGFESLTYFNRVFLRKKGLTPKQYREEIKVK
jgi:AraC-like DNA-binding protein